MSGQEIDGPCLSKPSGISGLGTQRVILIIFLSNIRLVEVASYARSVWSSRTQSLLLNRAWGRAQVHDVVRPENAT